MLHKKESFEKALIKNCRAGHLRDQEKLYKHFYGYAMGISLRYSTGKEEAMEVANDAFIKLFQNLDNFDESRPLKPWLRRMIINTALDQRRKDLKHMEVLDIECVIEPGTPFGVLETLEAQDILKMLEKLPPIQKLVFNMYEIDGYRHEEIANLLNIPASSSRVHLSRAKERLKNNWFKEQKHGKAV